MPALYIATPIRTCVTPAAAAEGAEITPIEGLGGPEAEAIHAAAATLGRRRARGEA